MGFLYVHGNTKELIQELFRGGLLGPGWNVLRWGGGAAAPAAAVSIDLFKKLGSDYETVEAIDLDQTNLAGSWPWLEAFINASDGVVAHGRLASFDQVRVHGFCAKLPVGV
jgi:hypothetical protein